MAAVRVVKAAVRSEGSGLGDAFAAIAKIHDLLGIAVQDASET